MPSATLTTLCGHHDRGASNWTDRPLIQEEREKQRTAAGIKSIDQIKRLTG
jgi:hypothetical protein